MILKLHDYHNYYHYFQNIVGWKYKGKRLEFIDIPKELIEVLQNVRFTIEKILDSTILEFAKKLQNNSYLETEILKETKETIGKISRCLLL